MTVVDVLFAAAMLVVLAALFVGAWLLHDASRRWVQRAYQPAPTHVRLTPAFYDWQVEERQL